MCARREPEGRAPERRHKLRVLLIENSAADAEPVVTALAAYGFEPEPLVVGDRAGLERALAESVWDLVLAEATVGDLTGLDALELVLEHAPVTPFVLLSGPRGDDIEVAAIKAGARGCVQKDRLGLLAPVVHRVLVEAVVRRQHLEAERALQESEERYRRLAENAPDIIFRYRLKPTRTYEYVSRAIERILGYTPAEYQGWGDPVENVVEPDDLGPLRSWRAAIEGGETPVEPLRIRFRHKDGRLVWTESREVPVFDEQGTVIAVEGIMRDVTSRHHAEREQELLARQQEVIASFGQHAHAAKELVPLLQEATELIADALSAEFVKFVEPDPDGGRLVLRAGVGWEGDWIGRAVASIDDASPAARALRANEDVIVVDLDSSGAEVTELLQRHGVASGVAVVVPGEARALGILGAYSRRRRVFTGMDVHFLQAVAHMISEVAERLHAEQERLVSYDLLLRSDRARRHLLASLVRAQEEERHRIATDIHDDSVQVLTALTLRLGILRRRIDEPELIELVGEIEESAQLSIARLRHLIFELHPPALDRNGLESALRLYLEQARVDFGVDYELRSVLKQEPTVAARATAYRIAQEALLNVCKHAGAKRVEVDLSTRDDGVLVEIADDGIGFEVDELDGATPGHIGLTSMRERAEMAGGWWSIESLRSGGTTITFFIPEQLMPEPVAGGSASLSDSAPKEEYAAYPGLDR